MNYDIHKVADEIDAMLEGPILAPSLIDFDLLRDFAVARDVEQEHWSCKPALQAIDLLENATTADAFTLQLRILYGVLLWPRELQNAHWGSLFRQTGNHRLDVKKLHRVAVATNFVAMACVFDDYHSKLIACIFVLPGEAPSRLQHATYEGLLKELPYEVRVQLSPPKLLGVRERRHQPYYDSLFRNGGGE